MWILRIVGVLYLISGMWCAFNASLSAQYLGFSLSDSFAANEFLSVYGGLQVGIAIAMIASSFKHQFLAGALFYSLVLSSGLALFRVMASFIYGVNGAILTMLILEVAIVLMLMFEMRRV